MCSGRDPFGVGLNNPLVVPRSRELLASRAVLSVALWVGVRKDLRRLGGLRDVRRPNGGR